MTNWKAIAIVAIILWVLTIMSFIGLLAIGNEVLEKEEICAYNVCSEYEAYVFHNLENMCYCYIGNEIAHWEYIV